MVMALLSHANQSEQVLYVNQCLIFVLLLVAAAATVSILFILTNHSISMTLY